MEVGGSGYERKIEGMNVTKTIVLISQRINKYIIFKI